MPQGVYVNCPAPVVGLWDVGKPQVPVENEFSQPLFSGGFVGATRRDFHKQAVPSRYLALAGSRDYSRRAVGGSRHGCRCVLPLRSIHLASVAPLRVNNSAPSGSGFVRVLRRMEPTLAPLCFPVRWLQFKPEVRGEPVGNSLRLRSESRARDHPVTRRVPPQAE